MAVKARRDQCGDIATSLDFGGRRLELRCRRGAGVRPDAIVELCAAACPACIAGPPRRALGTPVWTLLNADPDWRWMDTGSQSMVSIDAALQAATEVGMGSGAREAAPPKCWADLKVRLYVSGVHARRLVARSRHV